MEIKIYEKFVDNNNIKVSCDEISDIVENFGYGDFLEEAYKEYYYLDRETFELKPLEYEEEPSNIDPEIIKVAVKLQNGFVLGYGFYKNH